MKIPLNDLLSIFLSVKQLSPNQKIVDVDYSDPKTEETTTLTFVFDESAQDWILQDNL